MIKVNENDLPFLNFMLSLNEPYLKKPYCSDNHLITPPLNSDHCYEVDRDFSKCACYTGFTSCQYYKRQT